MSQLSIDSTTGALSIPPSLSAVTVISGSGTLNELSNASPIDHTRLGPITASPFGSL